METSENQLVLGRLPVGTRLIVQTRADWREAVVSKIDDEKVTLTVCSASGRTYRKRCAVETLIDSDGSILFLGIGIWRENFVKYDLRW